MTFIAPLIGVVAGVIGVAAYYKATILEDAIHRPKVAVEAKATDEDLELEVHRLEARVALLELTARTPVREVNATSTPAPPVLVPAPAAAPVPLPQAPAEASVHRDAARPPESPQKREEQKQRVVALVGTYWKDWAIKYGLSEKQTEALSSLQLDAATRKLENQSKMVDGKITQAEARADNQAAREEVRRKAQAVLTAEQFKQFEADKGAEWGSSYRQLREAHERATGAAP